MTSVSQFQQDTNVVSFFNCKKDLYFLDVCGYYAHWFSNTYLLEEKYNWKGVCVEPIPEVFQKLKNNRTAKCYNYALFTESNVPIRFSKHHLLSGRQPRKTISQHANKHIQSNKDKNSNKDNEIIVKTITLQDFIDKHQIPTIIHYLSLDTMGTELQLLKKFDFSKYKFLYISIENNNDNPQRDELKKLLLDNGYLYNKEDNDRHNYIHESTIVGTYYYKEDYTKPIVIKRENKTDFTVSCIYWDDEIGTYNNGFINWKTLGNGKVFYTHIEYGDGNVWHRDMRK